MTGCSAPLASTGTPKSSGKCSSALRTGIGVSPPIAHSDPLVIVVAQVLEQHELGAPHAVLGRRRSGR